MNKRNKLLIGSILSTWLIASASTLAAIGCGCTQPATLTLTADIKIISDADDVITITSNVTKEDGDITWSINPIPDGVKIVFDGKDGSKTATLTLKDSLELKDNTYTVTAKNNKISNSIKVGVGEFQSSIVGDDTIPFVSSTRFQTQFKAFDGLTDDIIWEVYKEDGSEVDPKWINIGERTGLLTIEADAQITSGTNLQVTASYGEIIEAVKLLKIILPIPETILKIENNVLTGLKDMAADLGKYDALVVPNYVTQLKEEVFKNFFISGSTVTNLILNEGLEIIGRNAFERCNAFTGELVIPSTMKTIGSGSFSGNSNFVAINILSKLENDFKTAIQSSAFHSCSKVTKITCNFDVLPEFGSVSFEPKSIQGTIKNNGKVTSANLLTALTTPTVGLSNQWTIE